MPVDYTITITNRQDADLKKVVDAYNAPLLLQTPPGNTLTKKQYLDQVLITPILTKVRADAAVADINALITALQKAADDANDAALAQVRTDLAAYLTP